GLFEIGYDGSGFAFDNELPRHRRYVERYALADRPVSNGEYKAFIADGGYRRADLWLSEGWDWINAQAIDAPLYWKRNGDDWQHFTLHGCLPLDPAAPVCHVNLYDADAYARRAGAGLPSDTVGA